MARNKLKHNILILNLFLIFGIYNIAAANNETVKNITKENITVKVLEIKIVPRIRLTEINSLKSYTWWNPTSSESKNNGLEPEKKLEDKLKNKTDSQESIKNSSLKIPVAFKTLLKKMKEDFLKENIDVKFYLSQVSSKNIGEYENFYLMTGNLIIDSKNKEKADLTELSFYQIKNSSVNLLFLSQTATFTSESSFRGLGLEFNEKINNKTYEKPDYKTSEFLLIFENELNYEELGQIRQSIAENLSIDINQVKLHSSETNKYTFKLFVTQNPFNKLQSISFVNGPYKSEIKDHQITFKTFSEEEVLEP